MCLDVEETGYGYTKRWFKQYLANCYEENKKFQGRMNRMTRLIANLSVAPLTVICCILMVENSLSNFAALPWVFILPVLTHYVGRKIPYFAAATAMCAVFVILYFSWTPHQILVAQVIQGLGNASNVAVLFHFVPEYCSPKYRGMFMNLHCTSFYWGLWVANAIGAYFPWQYIAVLGIISTLYTFTIAFCPESPNWLASKGKFEECETAHRWMRGSSPEAEKELRDLVSHQKEFHSIARQEKMTWSWCVQTVKSKQFYYPLLLTVLVGAQCNLSGKFICSIYAIDIIKKITKNDDSAISGMLILDGVTVCGMYLGSFLSKILKTRALYLRLMLVCVAFIFALSLYLYLTALGVVKENTIVSLSLMVGYSLSISCGPVVLSMSIYSEIISIRYQAVSYTISSFVYMITCTGMLKFSPIIFNCLGLHGSFLLYGISSSVCLALSYIYVPETKDKTLLEIESYFKDEKVPAEEDKLTI